MSKQPVIGKKPTMESPPMDFSPGWYRRATGISGHAVKDDNPLLPMPKLLPLKISDEKWDSIFPKEKPALKPKWQEEYDALPAMKPLPGPESVKPVAWEKPAPTVASSNALWSYLTKYLEVASGGRVELQSRNARFIRFKCTTCSDNWNVGEELFRVNESDTAVPFELKEWVEKHQHVCNNFSGGHLGSLAACIRCKWAHHKHAQAQPKYDTTKGQWVAAGVQGETQVIPATIPTGVKIAKNPTGRKFRE